MSHSPFSPSLQRWGALIAPPDQSCHLSAGPVHGEGPHHGVPERYQGLNRISPRTLMLFEAFHASGGEPELREVPEMWGFSGVNLLKA